MKEILVKSGSPKLFPLLVQAVVNNLRTIFGDNRYADKVIEHCLRTHPKWGARDRAFVAETTYNMVRNWRLFWFLSGKTPTLVPAHLWDLFGIYWLWKGYSLPNWQEFAQVKMRHSMKEVTDKPEILYSFPDWLKDMGIAQLGQEAWVAEMKALNQPAEVVLRVNSTKSSPSDLKKHFKEEEIETSYISEVPDALLLNERQNIFGHPLFLKGLFEVQDAGSQLIAPFLDVKPGMRVIDACAGAGGKSLHIAALMGNKGKLIAMDVEEIKLKELMKRAARAGVSIIEPRTIESTKTIKRLKESADRLLLDVPCSGIGVIRRNPDAKWKLSKEFIDKVTQTQKEILWQYNSMLKPGGIMVYATCSILPQENQQQVEAFLQAHGDSYTLLEEKTLLPSQFGFDGFYMAKLQKK